MNPYDIQVKAKVKFTAYAANMLPEDWLEFTMANELIVTMVKRFGPSYQNLMFNLWNPDNHRTLKLAVHEDFVKQWLQPAEEPLIGEYHLRQYM